LQRNAGPNSELSFSGKLVWRL